MSFDKPRLLLLQGFQEENRSCLGKKNPFSWSQIRTPGATREYPAPMSIHPSR